MTRKELYLGFYDKLNEPQRSLAKENLNLSHDEICEEDVFEDCIAAGFIWKNTQQGHNYWRDLHLLIRETNKAL